MLYSVMIHGTQWFLLIESMHKVQKKLAKEERLIVKHSFFFESNSAVVLLTSSRLQCKAVSTFQDNIIDNYSVTCYLLKLFFLGGTRTY